MTVSLNKKVPAFSSPVTGGKNWKLSDAAGKKLVLYFYPKDNTTGCTLEGQAFRDLHAAFKKAGTVVLGVSPDSVASHEKFKARWNSRSTCSPTRTRRCASCSRVEGEEHVRSQVHGRRAQHVLIDGGGVLRQEWRKVKVPGHADEVLAAAKAL
jgi:peroxiredoxin Q/BCP